MTERNRHIEVEGGVNIRDLGGYPTQDGQTTRWGVLIRSSNLDRITPAGQQRLLDYGVKTVIDLRDDEEVRDYPDVFAQVDAVDYRNLPLSQSGFASGAEYAHLGELYSQYLVAFRDNIGKIIAAISEAETAILFHCAVGKDRTGVVSALLLRLVGVADDVIADDYAQTTTQIAHLVAQWREYAQKQDHDMRQFERDVASDAESMLHTLKVLNSEYDGVVNYLRTCGVTDQQLAQLQTRLVSPREG